MKKKALYTSVFREIGQSKARFFSIMGIILLGVSFYAGIKATGPNMLKTAENYYSQQKLADGQVMSPLGLTDKELTTVAAEKNVAHVEGIKGVDSNIQHHNRLVRLQSHIFEKGSLNQPKVVSGHLPKAANEIVLDQRSQLLGDYQLGDSFIVPKENHADFRHDRYTIVGFVNSPVYIEMMSRGVTTIGKGTIDYFALLSPAEFTTKTYRELVYQFQATADQLAYSDSYKDQVTADNKKLKAQLEPQGQERVRELKDQLSQEEEKLKSAEATLDTTEKSFAAYQEQLSMVTGSGKESMAEELANKEKELAKGQEDLKAGQAALKKQQVNLARVKEEPYVFMTREENPGYSEYRENADRLSAIATVFPVFFFLIAALVCLTTMTRMVEEKRSEIGALKALGYSNWDISLKYTVYGLAASLVGSLLGLVIGYHVFPNIIIDAYGSLYNLPSAEVSYYLSYSLQSVIVAMICTLLSAMIVLRYDLFNSPATLLRPKAPKAGQRIFLEKLSFIWKRLNFNQKVTARNLFRYKQRMFMTVIGIAGCMALMITGFGIRDSISDVVELQFNKLWHYQGSVTFNEGTTQDELADYQKQLKALPNVPQGLRVAQKNVDVNKEKSGQLKVSVTVPERSGGLDEFILFNDRETGKKYHLTDDGVIINEKLAKLTDTKIGDNLQLVDSGGQKVIVKVSQIVENYAMHFVYMTPAYYQAHFNDTLDYNSELLRFNKSLTKAEEARISEKLLELAPVANVLFLSQTSEAMTDTIDSLTVVVWVLILAAALLAFIVLYNLTNINISERIRELSTIKVLGFYNREVTLYIYRENNILTLFGILLGCLVGKYLHRFVLATAEVDMLMFSPTIHGVSYLYGALLTILFSSVVMLLMHLKLKKVDMIEALKGNE